MKSQILICGDTASNDNTLLRELKSIGNISVENYRNGLNKIIVERHVDLAIIEYSDEWEENLFLVKQLKSIDPNLKIIIINGLNSNDVVIRSYQLGVTDYFKNPYDPKLVCERVRALLRKKNK